MFYGETSCCAIIKSTGLGCTNQAYFSAYTYKKDNENEKKRKVEEYLCGVHVKQCNGTARELPKNPDPKGYKKNITEQHQKTIEAAKVLNCTSGKQGKVILTRMFMLKNPVRIEGFYNIFPNFKHGGRTDGLGLPKLSPKSLGPIKHNMKDFPVCLSLENFHQMSKVYPSEYDAATGKVLEATIKERKEIYASNIPLRHKPAAKLATNTQKNKNINVPLFSTYYTQDGVEKRFSYLQCRWFYCYWYEKLVAEEFEYARLVNLSDSGYNINIVGYDAYPVDVSEGCSQDELKNILCKHYIDTTRPFGHELVLFSMLVLSDCESYPWNIYYNKNKELYEEFKNMFEKINK